MASCDKSVSGFLCDKERGHAGPCLHNGSMMGNFIRSQNAMTQADRIREKRAEVEQARKCLRTLERELVQLVSERKV